MHTLSLSFAVSTGGNSQRMAVGTASSQSPAMTAGTIIVTPDVNMFYRAGNNPTAASDGTDQILLANNSYRIIGTAGLKLAFIAPAAGNVYITQEA